jgi:general secretion pathway protein N
VGAALVPLRPLGHYHVALSLAGQPRFELRTTSGPLLLQGQGHWDGQRLRFQGWARADAAQANLLQPLLGALGQRQGQQASLNW